MSVLVDTNVIGELSRRRPNPRIVAWASELTTFRISVITIEEIAFGLAHRPNPRLAAWLDSFIDRRCRVLEVTRAIAHQAGVLRGELARRGQVRSQADMLIAATAAHHGLVLATRNTRHFAGWAITVVDPAD